MRSNWTRPRRSTLRGCSRIAAVAAVLAAGVALGPASVPARASGALVSWWQAEGNANDSVGTNNGTLVNGASFAPAIDGQAFSFDATGTAPGGNTPTQYVDVPDASNLDFGPSDSMTISAWIFMKTEPQQFEHIAGRRAFDCSGNIGYQFLIYNDGVNNEVVFGGVPGSGGAGGNVPINTWTHVAGTFDGSTGTFVVYVNGAAVNTSAAGESLGGSLTPLSTDFRIGTSCENYPFNGLIDEVRIYNTALSAAAVQQLAGFTSPLGPGYWKTHQAQTTALLPRTLGGDTVSTFAQATSVFDAMNCGSKQAQSAVGCLAGELLAAELNESNNALQPACLTSAVSDANTLLSSISYTGPGNYALTPAQRQTAVGLAGSLNNFNSGSLVC